MDLTIQDKCSERNSIGQANYEEQAVQNEQTNGNYNMYQILISCFDI